jgi:hypothetical protein
MFCIKSADISAIYSGNNSRKGKGENKMSVIDPVGRNVARHAQPVPSLNEPHPVPTRENGDTIDPVQSVSRTELRGDRRELTPDVDAANGVVVVRANPILKLARNDGGTQSGNLKSTVGCGGNRSGAHGAAPRTMLYV